MPRKNVIIVGGGSGTSVLARLLARGGYWVGDETKKVEYDTSENSELVDLNVRIFREMGCRWQTGGFRSIDQGDGHENPIYASPPSVEQLQELADRVELDDFKAFVDKCSKNQPWLWKDPRLCRTLFFWMKLFDLTNCGFIEMTRDLRQAWTGKVLRGKARVKFEEFKKVRSGNVAAARGFLDAIGAHRHELTFEKLIVEPEQSICGLNEFLGLELSIKDMEAVYRGKLYKTRWSQIHYVKAELTSSWRRYLSRNLPR